METGHSFLFALPPFFHLKLIDFPSLTSTPFVHSK